MTTPHHLLVPLGSGEEDWQVDAWYDRCESLEARVKAGLMSLHEIAQARREAGYTRRERMAEWVLLGHFHLDAAGNFATISKGAPADVLPFLGVTALEMGDVMTPEEALQFSPGGWTFSVGRGGLPPLDRRCDRCGQGWDLRNVTDIHWTSAEDLPRHRRCHELAIFDGAQREIADVVRRSEIPCSDFYMIPSGYDRNNPHAAPWFKLVTPAGHIRIGWRRRVLEIDWSDTFLPADGAKVVADPSITHGPSFVHAYGLDETVGCLRRLWELSTKKED